MANYSRERIRIFPQKRKQMEKEEVLKRISLMKKESRIYEEIRLFYPEDWSFVEIHFTLKWSSSVEDFFPVEEYDIWVINAMELGFIDSINFHTKKEKDWEVFGNVALYAFDKIVMYGEINKMNSPPNDFGLYLRDVPHLGFNGGYIVDRKGYYTSNNFFYGNKGTADKISVKPISSEFLRRIENNEGEGNFHDFIFRGENTKFIENFYRISQEVAKENPFPFIEKIEFYYKDRLTNRIEWMKHKDIDWWEWKHISNDGFHNCCNPEYFAYNFSTDDKKKW